MPALPSPCSLFHFHFPPRRGPFTVASPAYIDASTSETLSHEDLRSQALRLGHALRNVLRLQRGDVVLLYGPNSLAYPVAFFGAQAAGLVTTLANSAYKARELAFQVKDSGCKVMFVAPESVDTVAEALQQLAGDKGGQTDLLKGAPNPTFTQSQKSSSWARVCPPIQAAFARTPS